MKDAMIRQDFGWALKRMRRGLYVRRTAWGGKEWDYLYIKTFCSGTENEHCCVMYVNARGIEQSWSPDSDDIVESDYYEFFKKSCKVKKRHLRTA